MYKNQSMKPGLAPPASALYCATSGFSVESPVRKKVDAAGPPHHRSQRERQTRLAPFRKRGLAEAAKRQKLYQQKYDDAGDGADFALPDATRCRGPNSLCHIPHSFPYVRHARCGALSLAAALTSVWTMRRCTDAVDGGMCCRNTVKNLLPAAPFTGKKRPPARCRAGTLLAEARSSVWPRRRLGPRDGGVLTLFAASAGGDAEARENETKRPRPQSTT